LGTWKLEINNNNNSNNNSNNKSWRWIWWCKFIFFLLHVYMAYNHTESIKKN
jgi:hypothetical protein